MSLRDALLSAGGGPTHRPRLTLALSALLVGCPIVDPPADPPCPEDPAGTSVPTWFADNDRDGFGDPDDATSACVAPEGTVATAGDCDDGDRSLPYVAERECNGIDDDCDGEELCTLDADLSAALNDGMSLARSLSRQTWLEQLAEDLDGAMSPLELACPEPGDAAALLAALEYPCDPEDLDCSASAWAARWSGPCASDEGSASGSLEVGVAERTWWADQTRAHVEGSAFTWGGDQTIAIDGLATSSVTDDGWESDRASSVSLDWGAGTLQFGPLGGGWDSAVVALNASRSFSASLPDVTSDTANTTGSASATSPDAALDLSWSLRWSSGFNVEWTVGCFIEPSSGWLEAVLGDGRTARITWDGGSCEDLEDAERCAHCDRCGHVFVDGVELMLWCPASETTAF